MGKKSSVMLETLSLVENRNRGLRGSDVSKKKIPGWSLSTLSSPPQPRILRSTDRCMWWGSFNFPPRAGRRTVLTTCP